MAEGLTQAQVAMIGRHVGVDFRTVPFAQFRRGLSVEMEHAHTVQYNMYTVARIALDHLREDPYYYRKLARVHRD